MASEASGERTEEIITETEVRANTSEQSLPCSSRGVKANIAVKSITSLLGESLLHRWRNKDEEICPESYESVQEI